LAIGAKAICCASHASNVVEVARVVRPGPRPRDRLHAHAAVMAAQPPQLALDPAAAGAKIQVPPALEPAVVDLELRTGLAAPRADAPAAPQPHRHDHGLGGEADVDDRRSGQAEQPLECRDDARRPPSKAAGSRHPAACEMGGGASITLCATSDDSHRRERPAQVVITRSPSPTSRAETHKFHAKAYITHGRLEVVASQALVESSNFTHPGLTQNVELNLNLESRLEVAQLQEWYERHWRDAVDVTPDVLKTVERHNVEHSP
jgi:hypothetical protein